MNRGERRKGVRLVFSVLSDEVSGWVPFPCKRCCRGTVPTTSGTPDCLTVSSKRYRL